MVTSEREFRFNSCSPNGRYPFVSILHFFRLDPVNNEQFFSPVIYKKKNIKNINNFEKYKDTNKRLIITALGDSNTGLAANPIQP